MASFREASLDGSEDEMGAAILYNAFLHAWEPNWWQCLNEILLPIPIDDETLALSAAQASRLQFYRALLKCSRTIGTSRAFAIPRPDPAGGTDDACHDRPAAVIIWLPPKARPTFLALLRSGMLLSVLRCFGLTGAYRLWYFEDALQKLYSRASSPLGYKQEDGAFVQIIATDPAHGGHGYSAKLLKWQIDRHREDFPSAPVFLDTVSDYGQRVYERLAFRKLGRVRMETGRNMEGLPFGSDISDQEKERVAAGLGQTIFILAGDVED